MIHFSRSRLSFSVSSISAETDPYPETAVVTDEDDVAVDVDAAVAKDVTEMCT